MSDQTPNSPESLPRSPAPPTPPKPPEAAQEPNPEPNQIEKTAPDATREPGVPLSCQPLKIQLSVPVLKEKDLAVEFDIRFFTKEGMIHDYQDSCVIHSALAAHVGSHANRQFKRQVEKVLEDIIHYSEQLFDARKIDALIAQNDSDDKPSGSNRGFFSQR